MQLSTLPNTFLITGTSMMHAFMEDVSYESLKPRIYTLPEMHVKWGGPWPPIGPLGPIIATPVLAVAD